MSTILFFVAWLALVGLMMWVSHKKSEAEARWYADMQKELMLLNEKHNQEMAEKALERRKALGRRKP